MTLITSEVFLKTLVFKLRIFLKSVQSIGVLKSRTFSLHFFKKLNNALEWNLGLF